MFNGKVNAGNNVAAGSYADDADAKVELNSRPISGHLLIIAKVTFDS